MLSRPGLRVFADERFRTALAGLLLGLGLVSTTLFLLERAALPLAEGQFGIDFADYYGAAVRLGETGTPYAPDMLAGPVDAQGLDRYRYPPPLAQVMVPVTAVPLPAATWLWLACQAAAIAGAAIVAARAAGLHGREAWLWVAAATVWFRPVVDALWKGNVSGLQALLIGLLFAGVARGGAATAVNGLLKALPLALAPIVLVRNRRSAAAFTVALAVVAVPSLLLAPQAWSDYVIVLGTMLAGGSEYANNLAPAAVTAQLAGTGGLLADAIRWASVGAGLAAIGWGIVQARRPGGWHAAAVLGTGGMLLLSPVVWYHYLVVLLPLAVVAWPSASTRARSALLLGGAAVTMGVSWLPLAVIGAALMVGAAVWAVTHGPAARLPVEQTAKTPRPVQAGMTS